MQHFISQVRQQTGRGIPSSFPIQHGCSGLRVWNTPWPCLWHLIDRYLFSAVRSDLLREQVFPPNQKKKGRPHTPPWLWTLLSLAAGRVREGGFARPDIPSCAQKSNFWLSIYGTILASSWYNHTMEDKPRNPPLRPIWMYSCPYSCWNIQYESKLLNTAPDVNVTVSRLHS